MVFIDWQKGKKSGVCQKIASFHCKFMLVHIDVSGRHTILISIFFDTRLVGYLYISNNTEFMKKSGDHCVTRFENEFCISFWGWWAGKYLCFVWFTCLHNCPKGFFIIFCFFWRCLTWIEWHTWHVPRVVRQQGFSQFHENIIKKKWRNYICM